MHAVLIHGILVLPLLAWAISKTGWDERTQARAVRAGMIVYAVVVVVGAAAASVLGAASP